jgi:hypothetical protein
MNSIKHIAIEEFKRCAAKGCSNPGTFEMEILFLGRKGWFCTQCKDSLMRDGILIQQQEEPDSISTTSSTITNTTTTNSNYNIIDAKEVQKTQ